MRVPAIARFPGRIPAGSASAAVMGLADVLPTVARLAGAAPPADRRLDGVDLWAVLSGERDDEALAERVWAFYRLGGLEAVRCGRFKLHLPHPYVKIVEPGVGGEAGRVETREIGRALFDLERDPGESVDVADEHPAVVGELEELAEGLREDLGDTLTGRVGSGVRPAGRVAEAPADEPTPAAIPR